MNHLSNLTQDQLIGLIAYQNEIIKSAAKNIQSLQIDPMTGIMNASGAFTFHSTIPADKALLMIDMCNVHAMNHKYTMDGTNERWINIFSDNRLEDTLIKYGGDEFVVILDSNDVAGYIERLENKMIANDVYAIVSVVNTSNSLKESIDRADEIVTAAKYTQEINGMKPSRDTEYCIGDTHIIYE